MHITRGATDYNRRYWVYTSFCNKDLCNKLAKKLVSGWKVSSQTSLYMIIQF